ncbi:hypothetical protein RI054_16g76610 [Pseudoscourfieldia marina]
MERLWRRLNVFISADETRTGVDGAHNEEHAEGEHALNVAQAAGDDAGGLRAGLEDGLAIQGPQRCP